MNHLIESIIILQNISCLIHHIVSFSYPRSLEWKAFFPHNCSMMHAAALWQGTIKSLMTKTANYFHQTGVPPLPYFSFMVRWVAWTRKQFLLVIFILNCWISINLICIELIYYKIKFFNINFFNSQNLNLFKKIMICLISIFIFYFSFHIFFIFNFYFLFLL